MKKVLITGGAGFIGYHLASKLLSLDYKVDLLDNFSRGLNDSHIKNLAKNNNISIINGDLFLNEFSKKLSENYFNIYHFAAVVGVQHVIKSPYEVLDKNITLLKNAIAIAKKQRNLNRFVFASTSEIYSGTLSHYGLEFPTLESTPLTTGDLKDSRTSYMLSKIYGEAMCYHSNLPITIIRPHNFYGPRMGLSHVIPEIMKKIFESKVSYLDVYSANHKRTFCYISDAVNAILALVDTADSLSQAYNIGSESEEITMGNLSKKIMKMMGKNLIINPLPPTSGSPERRCPSIKKLKKDTNFVKQFSLDEGLIKTYKWYKNYIFSGKEESAE